MQQDMIWEKDGYTLRLARASDAGQYYAENYCPLDAEAARLTGCRKTFSKEEVISFFQSALVDVSRYFFLILASDGTIIGESVLNEIDRTLRSANFRICIFRPTQRNRGIGTWAIETTRDFAFEKLHLHRLTLDVYSFNPRAEQAYRNAGFRREGVLRDAVLDNGRYADVILMSILEEEWRMLKNPS